MRALAAAATATLFWPRPTEPIQYSKSSVSFSSLFLDFYACGLCWGSPGDLLGLFCGFLGTPGVIWGLLGDLVAFWWSLGRQCPIFWIWTGGPGNGNFLLQFAFKSDLKPVLVTLGSFRLILGVAVSRNSHPRSGFIVISAFWHSKFAFSLRIYSKLCLSSIWLAFKISIPAADL